MYADDSTPRPPREAVPALHWLFGRWIWGATLVLYLLLVIAVASLSAVLYGSPPVRTAVLATTTPSSVLIVFLGARALAFGLEQWRRDLSVGRGTLRISNRTSVGALLTLAAFSVVGLIAAAVALPILYTADRNYTLLTAAIAVLAVPPSYALLVVHLSAQMAADRYLRGLAVAPSVGHFLWTLPVVTAVWLFALGRGEITAVAEGAPLLRASATASVTVSLWGLFFAAVCAPTVLTVAYVFYRTLERVVRATV